jgi:hypothetical protein
MARQVLSRSILLLFTRNTSDLQRYHQLRDRLLAPTHTLTHTTHQSTLHHSTSCGFAVRTARPTAPAHLAAVAATALVAPATRSTGSGASETSSRSWSIRAVAVSSSLCLSD